MKKLLLILVLVVYLVSCAREHLFKPEDVEIVSQVNLLEYDAEWTNRPSTKYIVRTQHLTFCTNNIYTVGDTIPTPK